MNYLLRYYELNKSLVGFQNKQIFIKANLIKDFSARLGFASYLKKAEAALFDFFSLIMML